MTFLVRRAAVFCSHSAGKGTLKLFFPVLLIFADAPKASGIRLSGDENAPSMKKIAILIAVFCFILLLTKIANQVPPAPPPGTAFSLKGVRVVQCSAAEITLVNRHQDPTTLEKDDSWPDCASFPPNEYLDFYLSRGEETKYLSSEASPWWRGVL